ncbi:MAG: SDR family NAD(P)-dependent oxidoreductase [Deltaproteobacteria bacterium]|nr:SDR family NAD(P)-dependent oxidoreductase [Deltaproteobacteria bacterium]
MSEWAVVAGASEGIGAAFAWELARRGHSLVLIARRSEPLQALADALSAKHPERTFETLALDLGDPRLEERLRALAARDVGVVVYNAALSVAAPFLSAPIADHQRVLDVNAKGPMIFAHVFGEAMAKRGRGAIVLMSSLTAFWGSPWVASYGATKAFNLSLGEALAAELGPRGVNVLVCCAGATSTPGFIAITRGTKAPKAMTPDAVAVETMRAVDRRRRGAFVPGAFNRFAQWLLTRVFPRRLAVATMASETKKLLRP